MKRTSDSLISQPLAAPEDAWATLPGDLVRLLVSTDFSLLPSLFVLSKHFHLSLALAPPMSSFWRDYFNSPLGLSDFVADVAQGTTWKGLVRVKEHLPRTYYAKFARARFACGALRNGVRGLPCSTPGCKLIDGEHRVIDWVEVKVELCFNPMWESDTECIAADNNSDFLRDPYVDQRRCKFIYSEVTQSIDIWRRRDRRLESNYAFAGQAAVSPSHLDPKRAWKVDKFYGFV
jgi:hypothetical protein